VYRKLGPSLTTRILRLLDSKEGVGGKGSELGQMREAESTAAQHLTSSFSNPSFGVKIIFNYELRGSVSVVINM
jgi:hypothetical protein